MDFDVLFRESTEVNLLTPSAQQQGTMWELGFPPYEHEGSWPVPSPAASTVFQVPGSGLSPLTSAPQSPSRSLRSVEDANAQLSLFTSATPQSHSSYSAPQSPARSHQSHEDGASPHPFHQAVYSPLSSWIMPSPATHVYPGIDAGSQNPSHAGSPWSQGSHCSPSNSAATLSPQQPPYSPPQPLEAHQMQLLDALMQERYPLHAVVSRLPAPQALPLIKALLA